MILFLIFSLFFYVPKDFQYIGKGGNRWCPVTKCSVTLFFLFFFKCLSFSLASYSVMEKRLPSPIGQVVPRYFAELISWKPSHWRGSSSLSELIIFPSCEAPEVIDFWESIQVIFSSNEWILLQVEDGWVKWFNCLPFSILIVWNGY